MSLFGSGVNRFVDSKKPLAVMKNSVKGGLHEMKMGAKKVADSKAWKKVKSETSVYLKKAISKIPGNKDWEMSCMNYEPPRLFGLPDTSFYYLSVDENRTAEGELTS